MSNIDPQSAETIEFSQLIESYLPEIGSAVRLSCRRYKYHPSKDELADLRHEIVLLLIDDSYRRLRSFDHSRSSFNTWLNKVIRRYVSNRLHRQRAVESLEQLAPDSLIYQPAQEDMVIRQNLLQLLQLAISRLSPREKQRIKLYYEEELTAEEIARLMNIQVDSVYERRHAIVKKLGQQLMPHCTDGDFKKKIAEKM